MSKNKRSSNGRAVLKELQDCKIYYDHSESVQGPVTVRVDYKKQGFHVKIYVMKSEITSDTINEKNSKFDLYLKIRNPRALNKKGSLRVEILDAKYKQSEIGAKAKDSSPKTFQFDIGICFGSVILQPEMFIPEKWNENFLKGTQAKIQKSFLNSQKSKMIPAKKESSTNYLGNNVNKPFRGGGCSGK